LFQKQDRRIGPNLSLIHGFVFIIPISIY